MVWQILFAVAVVAFVAVPLTIYLINRKKNEKASESDSKKEPIKGIDYTKNLQLHIKVGDRPLEWRLGQAYFNYAYELYPEETEKLRSTKVDCFYVDERIPAFLDALNKELTKLPD